MTEKMAPQAPQIIPGLWEPAFLFEVRARCFNLLRMKANRSETDRVRLTVVMDALLAGLIASDSARAWSSVAEFLSDKTRISPHG